MSRILTLIAAASLLSLTACQKGTENAAEKAASAPAAAPAASAPASQPAAASQPATASQPAAAARPEAAAKEDPMMALARQGNCLTCHRVDVKLVGPAWKDVAAKYRGKPDAVATITSHIKKGGSFGWNFGVMPPRGGSQLSDADVGKLAKFIVGLK
jgi:cytochrome c